MDTLKSVQANRDPVLQDQQVLPEIRNRQLLLRVFSVIRSTEISLETPVELSPYVITYLVAYVIKYVTTYAATYLVTYAMSQAITYVMTYVHPNYKAISSANPHPQPPYQALAWSCR